MKVKGASKIIASTRTLGGRIRSVRKAWGWTQDRLATALKIDRQVVSYWERDVSKPSRPAIQLLANLFQMSPEALSSGVGFHIPDLPQWVDEDREKGIKDSLPIPRVGKVALIGTKSEAPKMITFDKAADVLREAEAKGKSVWLIIGADGP